MEELWGRHVTGLMAGLKRGFEDLLEAKLRCVWGSKEGPGAGNAVQARTLSGGKAWDGTEFIRRP